MAINASDVKKLREKTGAGMLDCKNALTEANGDFARAEKILKELGLAAAAKRSGRATNEGRIITMVEGKKAAILELSCETDFVALNKDFLASGEFILNEILANDLTEANSAIEEKITSTISTIKENIALRRFAIMKASENDVIVDYIHGDGKIGVLVTIHTDSAAAASSEAVKNFAFDCALHIAAYNPAYLSRDDVDQRYMKEQEEIFTVQAKNTGKPDNVVQGIVKGKLNKHLAEICMLDQKFVKDDKRSVSEVAKDIGKETGSEVNVSRFIYYSVGGEM